MKSFLSEAFLSIFLLSVAPTSVGAEVSASRIGADVKVAAEQLGADIAVKVSFNKGSADLLAEESEEIRDAILQARRQGSIKEIKVASWADREYPQKGERETNATILLADRRANEIRRYLLQDLNVSKISEYNMAKRPSALQRIFNTGSAQVKTALETTGAAPTDPEQEGRYNSKASTALVLIYTK